MPEKHGRRYDEIAEKQSAKTFLFRCNDEKQKGEPNLLILYINTLSRIERNTHVENCAMLQHLRATC